MKVLEALQMNEESKREKNQKRSRERKLNINIILTFTVSVIFLAALLLRYPQIVLSRSELYGEADQNLKDFQVSGDGLVSMSSDPWIEYQLSESVKVRVIELVVHGVEQDNISGEIYDMDTWECVTYELKNGHIMVFYPETAIIERNHFRFDLVTAEFVHLQLDEIVINSRYGLFYYVLPRLIGIWIFLFFYFKSVMYLRTFCKKRTDRVRKFVVQIYCIVPWLLFGVILYNALYIKISITLLLTMYLLLISEQLLCIMCLKTKENGSAGFRFLEILLFAFFNAGIIELISGLEYNFQCLWYGIWNGLLVLFVLYVLYFLLQNMKLAMIVLNILAVLLGCANHYFYLFRGKPLELFDILLADTALTVIRNYTYQIDNTICYLIFLEICIICYLRLYDSKREKKRVVQSASVMCVAIFVGIFVYSPGVGLWDPISAVKEFGYLSSFVEYAKRDLKYKKPKGYSPQKVEDILNAYNDEQKKVEQCPNIIVIMNESFADLPAVYGFETNADGMPFVHSLSDNTIKGNMLVSAYGGSTANTEYEFLTGNSLAFLNNGVVPYVQYVKRPQQSIAYQLQDMGYQTVAFHPYKASNYNRDKVYEYLGFEQFISWETGLKYDSLLRWTVSDEADFWDVIDIYENKKEGMPIFIFNVTMQNHGGYNGDISEVDCTVIPKDESLQQLQLMEYLTLIKESDASFEELISYFRNIDEKTLILMFGDHQPGLDAVFYDTLGYKASVSLEEREKLYTVPFVLWANYDINEQGDVLTSANYLRAMLMQNAGLPLSDYDQFILFYSEHYPAINAIGYIDADGNYGGLDNLSNDMGISQQYRILQYGNMFDKSISYERYVE